MRLCRSALLTLLMTMSLPGIATDDDPFLWLEEVDSPAALDWVRERNAVSQAELEALPGFEAMRQDLLAILDSEERIPYVVQRHGRLYNFWRDASHERGLIRRTTLREYRKAQPAWETVLDLDALARSEGENWIYKGMSCLEPEQRYCMIGLSRGGADATVRREFDLKRKQFVDQGFALDEAKNSVHWLDRNTLLVGTDFGDGTLTSSGYPRLLKRWRRGTPLATAEIVFEGQEGDVGVWPAGGVSRGKRLDLAIRVPTFFTREVHVLASDGQLRRVPVPDHADVTPAGDLMLVELRKDWTVDGRRWPAGSLLVSETERLLAGSPQFDLLFDPGPRKSLSGYEVTEDLILVTELDNVSDRLYEWRRDQGDWWRREVAIPPLGSAWVQAWDSNESNRYFMDFSGFLTPSTLYLAEAGRDAREQLKALPAMFDSEGLTVTQHEAVSADGTRVPYFQIGPAGLELDGEAPTLLYGYGGFQASEVPEYLATAGRGWLAEGGVYVVANIRGGGEFGPAWHQAALKDKRQRAYDDFIAVAEDLVARKLTRPGRLGTRGGSNGGLLMGVMLTQRPDLFGAIHCAVPLLDMRRYNKLLAGASWMAEYGDPDQPEEWAYIRRYSPFHNLDEKADYPPILFTTSTRDDRVHPGHARKMMARMEALGLSGMRYYENIEGGHGGAANNAQRAYMNALGYTFLMDRLGGALSPTGSASEAGE